MRERNKTEKRDESGPEPAESPAAGRRVPHGHPPSRIVQGSTIPTFVIDRRHVTTHWNRACENLTHIPAQEVIGTRNQWRAFYATERPVLADLIVDETPEKEIQRFYRGRYRKSDIIEGAYEAEGFFPDLGPGGRWLFFTAAPLRDDAGRMLGALETLQDITTRKKAEQDLRESEERYRILTEHVADGVMLVQDGELVFTNHAFNAMFGIPGSMELLGSNPSDLFDGDMAQAIRDQIEQPKPAPGARRSFQGPCRSRQGNEFWVEVRVNHVRIQGAHAVMASLRDITGSVLEKRAMEEEAEHLRQENIILRSGVKDRYRFGAIIGKSPAMQEVYERILRAATSDTHVILVGESGTGKELVAREIHERSPRRDRAFVPVHCGAIPEGLVESEFFGHKRGAFTGATADKTGILDAAHRGTLFLDEVGEISPSMQVKLLRAVGEGGFTPLGSSEVRRPDLRIIAATHRDLAEMVRSGRMRQDFYYRIGVIPIRLPPLRERKEDLPLLIQHFWEEQGTVQEAPPLTGKVFDALIGHDWPGNIRELQNVLHRYRTLRKIDFMRGGTPPADRKPEEPVEESTQDIPPLRSAVREVEKRLILRSLDLYRWHRGKVASRLGIDPKTLLKKMRDYGIAKKKRKNAKN